MEVLLRRDVGNLGQLGDVVEVAEGYARNFLLPRKWAVQVTAANMKMVEAALEARSQREQAELDRVGELAQRMSGFLCLIEMRATDRGHLFGSVGPEQVAETLVASGFEMIRPTNVNMVSHVEELGDCEVEIMLHPEVRVNITLRVAPKAEEEVNEQ